MEQLNNSLGTSPFLGIVLGVVIFAAGMSIGLVADTHQTDKTMQVCRDALELDDEIFVSIGSHIGAYDFTGAATYLQGVTSERHTLYAGCMEA